jgi:hypothetical protein
VYYCLIQFRNYQSSNFNILFLVFACYIVKQQANQTFARGLQKVQRYMHFNMFAKGKSDDMELFFGKFGINNIQKPHSKLYDYQQWISQYLVKTGAFIGHFVSDANLEIFNELFLNKQLCSYLSPEISQLVEAV